MASHQMMWQFLIFWAVARIPNGRQPARKFRWPFRCFSGQGKIVPSSCCGMSSCLGLGGCEWELPFRASWLHFKWGFLCLFLTLSKESFDNLCIPSILKLYDGDVSMPWWRYLFCGYLDRSQMLFSSRKFSCILWAYTSSLPPPPVYFCLQLLGFVLIRGWSSGLTLCSSYLFCFVVIYI